MGDPMKILICEPTHCESARIVEHLKSQGIAGFFATVATIEEVQAALANNCWDIVLCSHTPPSLDARRVLGKVRAANRNLLLIVLATELTEAASASMIGFGARDIVLKSDLARLSPVIMREIKASRQRNQLVRAAGRAEMHFRNIVESSIQGIMVRSQFKTQFVNPAFCKMFGYSEAELMEMDSTLPLHPEDQHTLIRGHIARRLSGDRSIDTFEVRGVRKDGSIFWCSKMVSVVEWDDEVAVQIAVVDITDRKNAEIRLAERERQYRETFENAPIPMVRSRHDRKIVEVNQAFADLIGLPKERLIGLRVGDFIPEESLAQVLAKLRQVWDRKIPRADVEHVLRRADGRLILVQSSSRLTPDSPDTGDGQPELIAQFQDITGRREAELALKNRKALYRELVEKSLQGFLVIDQSGRPIFTNQVFAELFGYTTDELMAMETGLPLYVAEDQNKLTRRRESLTAGDETVHRFEIRGVRKDGTIIWLDQLTSVIDWQGQRAVQIAAIDITERKSTASLLTAREQKYRGMFENAPVAMFRISRERVLLDVNRAFEDMLGYSRDELAGKFAYDLIHPADAEQVRRRTKWVWTGRVERIENEYRLSRKDGTQIWVSSSGNLTSDENGALNHLIVQLQDITERKKAEAELLDARNSLATSEKQYRELFDNAPVAVSALSINGKFLRTNQALRDLLGYSDEELSRMHPLDTVHPSQRAAVHQILLEAAQKTKQGRVNHDIQLVRKDGQAIWVWMSGTVIFDESGKPNCVLSHLQDITARKQIEAQLFRSQKMEALGNLAGGIAHDFNNMLLPIIGLTTLSKDDIPSDNPAQENLDMVIEAAEKARRLVSQILTFSRQDKSEIAPTDISSCIGEAVRLVRNILPSSIKVVDDIEPQAGSVLADSAQLHSVILNLGSNAAYAMNGRVGRFSIRLRDIIANSRDTEKIANLIPGKAYACIHVQDTGCGMAKETLDKIFNPFFTTKPVGEGTGLGLSMVHGIVERLGGVIHVASEVDIGTTFEIYLPLLAAERDDIAA